MSRLTGDAVHTGLLASDRLAATVFIAVVGSVGFSSSGLVAAVIGFFHPTVVVAAGIMISLVLGWMSWAPFQAGVRGRLGVGLGHVVAVVVIVVLSGISAAAFSSEHVATNRDPGVYVTTSVWLADHGNLVIDGLVGGFDAVPGTTASSLGNYTWDDEKTISPQFMHLLPVWGAAARWIGGDGALFRVNALIIVIAIAAFWLYTALILRPWYAVLATAGLATSLVTIHFARDLYAEPLTLLLTFAGLAVLLVAERVRSRGVAFLAGLTLGMAAAARIDAWLVVIGVVAYLELRWYVAEQRGDQFVARSAVSPVLLGLGLSGAVALADGLVRSAPYLIVHRQQVLPMLVLLILVVLGGAVLRGGRVASWVGSRLPTIRKTVSVGGAVFIVVGSAFLFFVRPSVQEYHSGNANPVIEFAQQAEGIPLDGTRGYFEWSMHWLAWYLGVGGLAVGVAGVALAWKRAIWNRVELLPFLMSAVLVSTIYLIRPSITGDQLWAMRRFLPITIPALVFGGGYLLDWLAQRWEGSWAHAGVFATAVVVLIGVPGYLAWPLRASTSYRGLYPMIQEVCAQLPADSAVLMAPGNYTIMFQAPIRTFCGVPVAGIKDGEDPGCVVELSRREWDAHGRALYIMGLDTADGSAFRSIVTYKLPEIVVSRRPVRSISRELTTTLQRAQAAAVSGCGQDSVSG